MSKEEIISWILAILTIIEILSLSAVVAISNDIITDENEPTKYQSINVKNYWAELKNSEFNENTLLPMYRSIIIDKDTESKMESILNSRIENPDSNSLEDTSEDNNNDLDKNNDSSINKTGITVIEVWCTEDVHLRSGESLESQIIDTILKGTKVLAINFDSSASWTSVCIDGENAKTGFIYTSYLSTEYVARHEYYYIYKGKKVFTMDHSLQDYGQDLIHSLGMDEYIPYWYVQCFQESRMTMSKGEVPHGGYYDWGIMQVWEGLQYDKNSCIYDIMQIYSDYKTDPYDNITCGIYAFYYWYQKQSGDIIKALGSYLSGSKDQPSEKYINDVLSHWDSLYKE